ncbi:MAG: acyl-CoA/acyl-ACP dehydrogenase [Pegethrix bostrychoides GSE-TBD4-15B]|uniref:Acyl-CoA/acyl-ACP dehydrogenase n=1 Tax=Pegethrix bostrychoides GSE-TBD4-15B TaxID=2839662 RepID=A0A951U7H8_9CYAN|nr:acyl-CoA/acyl-ACP dehydrogenase [Pegethrix bostrychoides GSE-TBD4-15B]
MTVADAVERAIEVSASCAAQASKIDQHGALPIDEFNQLRQAGLLIAPLAAEWGGLGLGIDASRMSELLQILKHIGRGNLAVGRIYEGHVNAMQLVQTFGTTEQIAAYAEDILKHHRVFGVWNAEANDGVRLDPLESGGYQLIGSKTFCSGAGLVERPFVSGILPDGRWQMCITPMEQVTTRSQPDWWQPMGMKATASYKIDFTGVKLAASAIIGRPDDYHRQPWLSAGAIRFAAVQLGGAEALFDATRVYLQSLNRIDDPYQAARLGQMAIAVESGDLWLRGAAERIAAYAPEFGGASSQTADARTEKLINYVNMARTAIEQSCIDVIQLCERSVGTRGLLPPHPMERIVRDLSLYLRQPAFDMALAAPGRYALTQAAPAHALWQDE